MDVLMKVTFIPACQSLLISSFITRGSLISDVASHQSFLWTRTITATLDPTAMAEHAKYSFDSLDASPIILSKKENKALLDKWRVPMHHHMVDQIPGPY